MGRRKKVKYIDFRSKLQKKDISGAFLFLGEEALIANEIIEYIKNNFIKKEFLELNYSNLKGENLNLDEFYSAIETLPFMSEYRLVTIDSPGLFYKNNKIRDEFYKSLDSIDKSIIVIFEDFDQSLKKQTKLFKYFSKNKRTVEFNKLDRRSIRTYIKDYLRRNNKYMNDGDMSYFILLTGYENKNLQINLYEIKSELDKLIALSDQEQITKDQIDQHVERVNDSNIFNLLDSLQNKNTSQVISYLHDLYEKDEPATLILHMVQRRFRHLYAYAGLSEDGYDPREIKKTIKVSDYEFRNISKYGSRMTTCSIKDKLEIIYQTDKLLKSTSINELILLEYMLVNLCK